MPDFFLARFWLLSNFKVMTLKDTVPPRNLSSTEQHPPAKATTFLHLDLTEDR